MIKFGLGLGKMVRCFALLFLVISVSCLERDKKEQAENLGATSDKGEAYRPNFHFSPEIGWMNDPNGMFFYNGYYHLYFQHYPDDKVWGPMHWGHAVSTDMVRWKEQPIALYPDELGYIFSGSAVVDHENTSGFGVEGSAPVVAIFTSHDPKKAEAEKIDVETQSIAFSLDEGQTWTKYDNNPVIENPGARDFRDPKVSWHEPLKKWIMVLAAGQEIRFYSSENLKSWTPLSSFGEGIGNHNGVWECPDLFQLPVKGGTEKKWVLLVSINPGGPNGGSATQYFIGDFDGEKFIVDNEFEREMKEEHDFWVDFGPDNYAGVTWSNVEPSQGGKFFMGWMSNWLYANEVPTDPWRSAMTVARTLQLIKSGPTYRVVSEPVDNLNDYRGTKFSKDAISLNETITLVNGQKIDLARAEINFVMSGINEGGFDYLLSNPSGDELSFGYDASEKHFYVDRSLSGKTDFSEEFADTMSTAPRTSNAERLHGKILLDATSIELFFDDGETVMTEIFFPKAPFEKLDLTSDSNGVQLELFEIHELNLN